MIFMDFGEVDPVQKGISKGILGRLFHRCLGGQGRRVLSEWFRVYQTLISFSSIPKDRVA